MGEGHVLFLDAAHPMWGAFLWCVWCLGRVFVRAGSVRQRLNVLGAWNAVTWELISVTNTSVVNKDTMCQLLRAVAGRGWRGPITLVLDNARYQRNATVQGLAKELVIRLLYLPSYSPNLNVIERLRKLIRRQVLYGRYYARFEEFRGAIEWCLCQVNTVHKATLKRLMTLEFPTFENVSILDV